MKAHQWLAVFALSALAAPQDTNLLPSESNRVRSSSGFDIDPTLSDKTALDTIPDNYDAVKRRDMVLRGDILKRQAPTSPSTMSADGASQIKVAGGKQGVIYRGDSRPPAEVFKSGFTPQGGDTNLQHHLSFTGNSAYVSVTRSPQSAERYAFGRTGAQKDKGYIYVIAPKDVPRGYWVPGIYPSDRAVINNQEFAVQGAIPGSSIAHAYEVPKGNPSDRSVKIKNENYILKKSPGCFGLKSKRALCDPAKGENGRSGPKVSKSIRFRVAKSVGKSIAFMAVVPYARDLLNLLKQWDNPIGHAVKWFDDAIASLQEAIGGPQRKDIYGNELKGRIIDALKSISLETDYDRRERLNKEAMAREKARKDEEEKENRRIKGLEELADVCGKMDTEKPEDGNLASRLEKSCGNLAAEIQKIEDKEEEKAAKRDYVFGDCKCDEHYQPIDMRIQCNYACKMLRAILSATKKRRPDFEAAYCVVYESGTRRCGGVREQPHFGT